tara:strand:- start:259 stop:438 length:180 start_codon:yes stop_codon:yes gene_type:complete
MTIGTEKLYQVTNPDTNETNDLQYINVDAKELPRPSQPFFEWLESITSKEKGKSFFDWL